MSILYNSSKGPIEVSSMALPYAKNALRKLRTDDNRHRTAEIGALELHIAKMEAEGAPPVGHNQPPADELQEQAEMSWDAIRAHMDDLLTEAANWADGMELTTQEQANAAGDLRRQLQDAAKIADNARTAEKAPLDKAVAEIQDRYNAYIAPLKNKNAGKVSRAVSVLGNVLSAWLNKQEEEKRQRERAAFEAAEKARQDAIAARAEIETATDLAAVEAAESMLDAAADLERAAKAVAKEKVQAKGEGRATGLRTRWIAKLDDDGAGKALTHYVKTQPDRVKAFLRALADEDCKAGIRSIPGFTITPEKYV